LGKVGLQPTKSVQNRAWQKALPDSGLGGVKNDYEKNRRGDGAGGEKKNNAGSEGHQTDEGKWTKRGILAAGEGVLGIECTAFLKPMSGQLSLGCQTLVAGIGERGKELNLEK